MSTLNRGGSNPETTPGPYAMLSLRCQSKYFLKVVVIKKVFTLWAHPSLFSLISAVQIRVILNMLAHLPKTIILAPRR